MKEDKLSSNIQLDKKKKQSQGFRGLFFCCLEKEDEDVNGKNNQNNLSSTTSRSTGP